MEGLHIDFERISGWMKLDSAGEFGQLVDRYEKFEIQVDQVIGCLKAGVAKGLTNHDISMVSWNNLLPKNSHVWNKSHFFIMKRQKKNDSALPELKWGNKYPLFLSFKFHFTDSRRHKI